MSRNSDTFWSRVLFKDFIRHFRKMSPEEIAEDIKESMDALDDLNPDGDSFGSLMVRWANERMNGAFATAARENGKKGGRPRKDTTADAPTRVDGEFKSDSGNAGNMESATSANNSRVTTTHARQSQREGEGSLRLGGHVTPSRTCRPPRDFDEVKDFIAQNGLDYDDARLWWERNYVERDGIDKDGKPIKNWKGALVNACKAEETKRRSA